jgi:uncharacterized PurR-regulated membrane protein YhhQ (DUF165 family)
MRTDTHEDPWLLPTHQYDYPTREVVPVARLHGRREGTFLVLAAMFLLATITLPLLGTSRIFDLALVFPGLELPLAMHLPIGVLAFPLGFAAIDLVCELYGRRRASALLAIGTVVIVALVGLMRIVDNTGGVDQAFGPALAFAACYVVANLCNLMVFDALRRRMGGRGPGLRSLVTAVVAQLVGWCAFAFVLYAYVSATAEPGVDITEPITALVIGALAYAIAAALALVIPVVIAARTLAGYLRVSRIEAAPDDDGFAIGSSRRRLPPAVLIDSSPAIPALPRPLPKPAAPRTQGVSERRAARKSIQPFNSAEMRFFTEGDEQTEPTDSSDDLAADAARARVTAQA